MSLANTDLANGLPAISYLFKVSHHRAKSKGNSVAFVDLQYMDDWCDVTRHSLPIRLMLNVDVYWLYRLSWTHRFLLLSRNDAANWLGGTLVPKLIARVNLLSSVEALE